MRLNEYNDLDMMGDSETPIQAIIHFPQNLRLTYHAEGAANIVYKIDIPDRDGAEVLPTEIDTCDSATRRATTTTTTATPPSTELESWEVDLPTTHSIYSQFKGKLLRLRKDVSHTTSPLQDQYEFERHIKPLFEAKDLIESTVVSLDSNLISSLNQNLKSLETSGVRPSSRVGSYLKQILYGTLVDDAGYGLSNDSRIFELKPKWLVQSPDAPKQARRCRTCALRALRVSSNPLKDGKSKAGRGFCRLDLASQDEQRIAPAMDRFLSDIGLSAKEKLQVVLWLANSSLIQRLRDTQESLHPNSVFSAHAKEIPFLTLMTIRDCSLFITVSASGVSNAQLADLDMKSALRVDHWRSLEQQLLDGQWYTKVLPNTLHGRCALEDSYEERLAQNGW